MKSRFIDRANRVELERSKDSIEAQEIAIMSTEKGLSTVPSWDGKTTTAGMYISKVEAMMEYHGNGDAMDKTAMANCPTKSEYANLKTSSDDGDKKKVKLYEQNKKACGIMVMVMGQKTDHGLAMIEKTKTDDHPHGIA